MSASDNARRLAEWEAAEAARQGEGKAAPNDRRAAQVCVRAAERLIRGILVALPADTEAKGARLAPRTCALLRAAAFAESREVERLGDEYLGQLCAGLVWPEVFPAERGGDR